MQRRRGRGAWVAWLVVVLRWVEALAPDFHSIGLHSRADVYWWLVAAITLVVGPVLAISDAGLIVRIWLSESSLVAYAKQVETEGADYRRQGLDVRPILTRSPSLLPPASLSPKTSQVLRSQTRRIDSVRPAARGP